MLRLFGYLIGFALLVWVAMIVAGYAVLVATVGGVWALVETNARRQGRAHVPPGQRFLMVWTRGISPVDPKHWITPQRQAATDPRLLPGHVTGDLRVEPHGVERVDEAGPFERYIVHARLHNHGIDTVRLDDIDHVDVQLWTPAGKVVGRDALWSTTELAPGLSCDVAVTVRLVDDQPVASWAIAHRPRGGYVFFTAATKQLEGTA